MSDQYYRGGHSGSYGAGNYGRPRMSIGGPFSNVVKVFMIACGVMYVLQILFPALTKYFGLTPLSFWHGAFFQIFTFHFLHGGLLHLLFNMLVFWMFGSELERLWGAKRFIVYMVVTGLGAGLCQVVFTPSLPIPVIGASGIVYGILLAYGVTYPNRMVYIYFLFPVKVKYLVIFMGVIELVSSISVQSQYSGVAHLAHLGGMVFGLGFLFYRRLYYRLRDVYYRRKLDKLKKERSKRIYVVRGDDDDKPFYH